MPGKFIVFEGMDGSGKSSAAKLLAEKLRQLKNSVCYGFAPGTSDAGAVIRSYLFHAPCNPVELPLLFTADRVAQNTFISNMLDHTNFVIWDRYSLSTRVYQDGVLPRRLLKELCTAPRFQIVPDVLVYVSIDVQTALTRLERRKGDRSIFEREDELKRIHETYEKVVHGPERSSFCKEIVTVDNNGSPEQLEEQLGRLASTWTG